MIFKSQFSATHQNRKFIQQAYLADEAQCMTSLLQELEGYGALRGTIQHQARELVIAVRENTQSFGGLNAFLQEYDLSSREGIVLLCLAEALLRIPDADTADRLIRDKLTNANWEQHLGQSQSWFVNAGTWGLMLTGRMINLDEATQQDPMTVVNGLMARASEPVVRSALREAMRIMGHQFVMGRTIEEALARSEKEPNRIYRYSYDMLGEAALCQEDADRYADVYRQAINAIAAHRDNKLSIEQAPGISVKLSALHPRFEYAQRDRLTNELIPKVMALAEVAQQANISMTIDGEEADRLDITLDVIEAIIGDPQFAAWPGLGVVVQTYQKRAPHVIDWLGELVQRHQRRIMVRLVKGAYWDTEIKRAQEQGLAGYPVFTRKQHTDVSYLACAQKLLTMGEAVYPQFATHNAHTAAAVIHMAGKRHSYEMQRLHGMGEALYQALLDDDNSVACRVYAPVGSHKDLLPYLVRRLLENGANTSFVNRITDDRQPIDDIVADPVQRVQGSNLSAHPRIPLPVAMFGEQRRNSSGINLSDEQELLALQSQIEPYHQQQWLASPLVDGNALQGDKQPLVNPANHQQIIGEVIVATEQHVEQAITSAQASSIEWDKVPGNERAAVLDRAADLLEQQRAKFISLIIREGGRCIPDALSEVREAVDFCRYYAHLARVQITRPQELPGPTGESNVLTLHGRGVFVCISPWNFPLAIFCGQVAAALVTGNSVIAKPASQTPLVAMEAVQLLHKAGVPGNVLQLLPGSGTVVGNRLVTDPRIAGVAFTGSTQTANNINLKLAQRSGSIVPFIAETGGQNAMIVDSSALPEQVVVDVIKSAFNSAGQRCSALRVLFVQQDVAPRMLSLLKGAIQELNIGEPSWLSTDVGPVIDSTAQHNLQQHIAWLQQHGRLVCELPENEFWQAGTFVAPCVYEIEALSQLKQEVFGPILHVILYKADQLDEVIQAINATHYGLTLGIHSRIEEKARYIQQRVRVGNIYVNRNIVGSVVGVQPFGGEGLSGTGPKAGGPHYLYRFTTERVFTNNSSAIGGNATLLTLK
ncbi:MAG: bifunctional proline dehydrogenase/L-glutamate gamma-semialdehyde dehydrogenase PutA [Gammaproteobacteria bacterium]|jgi:RHH-type proline utilization regulon transcriptional repressor/proline dehydrogenase/delta 1-pyrroline-5-carboxylate dehydrogenase